MRHQLASYSPLEAGRLLAAARTALRAPEAALHDLEARLSARFEAPLVVLTDSGTHALQVALELARELRPGGPVALPAYSCFDLVTAAVGAKTAVAFYDVDPISLAPDMTSLSTALAGGGGPGPAGSPPVAVVAGNLYGFPLDWTALRDAADAAGALLIEDAAQGIGSRWAGREGGCFGDLTVLSFGRGKGWTGGGGGALLVRRPDLLDRARARSRDLLEQPPPSGTRTWALSMIQWGLGRPRMYGLPNAVPGLGLGETVYKAPSPPRSMPPVAAATLLAHEHPARTEVEHRRASAGRWSGTLEAAPATPCRPLAGGEASYLRFPVLVSRPEVRLRLTERGGRLGASQGYPLPLPLLDAVEPFRVGAPGTFAGAERLARELITLPVHSLVSEGDRRRLLERLGAATTTQR